MATVSDQSPLEMLQQAISSKHKKNEVVRKDWGLSERIFFNCAFEVYRQDIQKGGKSTNGRYHKHLHKYNLFYIEDGVLDLYIKTLTKETKFRLSSDPDIADMVQYTVFPGTKHRFVAMEDTILYEVYYTFCNIDDIKREESGR